MADDKTGKASRAGKLVQFLRDNSLTIAMVALFVVCFSIQSIVGWHSHNDQLAQHGRTAIGYGHYLVTSSYVEGLSSNWQAAFLQLATLIVFGGVFYQRGAPHSRDPDKPDDEQKEEQQSSRRNWLYRHSLSVAFVLLFLTSLAIHAVSGAKAYNAQLLMLHKPPISFGAFLVSSKFWSVTLQTWQAEYMTIACYLLLSVFLREQRSSESKPVDSQTEDTGESNE